jgi:hypothetical protein
MVSRVDEYERYGSIKTFLLPGTRSYYGYTWIYESKL